MCALLCAFVGGVCGGAASGRAGTWSWLLELRRLRRGVVGWLLSVFIRFIAPHTAFTPFGSLTMVLD
eukprot:6394246-Heterocapsa_arctica.AAC.1